METNKIMFHKFSINSKVLAGLGIGLIGGSVVLMGILRKDGFPRLTDRSPDGFMPIPGVNSRAESSLTGVHGRLRKMGIGLTADQWLEAVLSTQGRERDDLLRELIEACYKSEYEFAPVACELATMWAESEPGPALRFLSNIHGLPGVIPVERKLTEDWVTGDIDGALSYLGMIANEDSMVPVGQLAMISSLAQVEKPEIFEKFAAWVDSLKGERTKDLRNSALQTLVETSEPGSFGKIGRMLEGMLEEPFVAALAGDLASRQVRENSAEAIGWVRGLPAGEARASAIESLFYGLAQSHPEEAVALINGNDLADFASGTSGTPEFLHDQVLSQFLEGLVGTAPDYAIRCVPGLHDTVLQEKYLKLAREMLESSAGLEVELSEKDNH